MFVPPPGLTEKVVLETIERVVKLLVGKFDRFPHLSRDDVAQELRTFMVEALARYDPSRPLEPFLATHARNRIANLFRDQVWRSDSPCKACLDGNWCSAGGPCEVFREWRERNERKRRICGPRSFNQPSDLKDSEPKTPADAYEHDVETAEIMALVSKELPTHLRKPWLLMREDIFVPKPLRKQVEIAIRVILERHNIDLGSGPMAQDPSSSGGINK